MSYLIAVASSDGNNVDIGFGAAKGFRIYEVDGTDYKEKEYREFTEDEAQTEGGIENTQDASQIAGCPSASSCGSAQAVCGDGAQGGCGGNSGGGCGGPSNGCGGSSGAQRKVDLISDCRSLVCRKIGFQAQKQLEKKAIAGFDVDCSVDEALVKIATYFNKLDNHISLRRT